MSLVAVRTNLVALACNAPADAREYLMERTRLNKDMEHLPSGEQQCLWQGIKRTPPPIDAAGQAVLRHLPNVSCGESVCGDDKIVRFSIVGELAFRDTPGELIGRAAGAREVHLTIDTPGGCGDWAHQFGTGLRGIGCRIVATARHAFSAGALLLQYAHVRRIHMDGRLMVHGPQFACCGSAEDFLNVAVWLEQGKAEDIRLFTQRTGQPRETVERWLAGDNYFSPSEAIAHGLADEIVD